MVTIFNLFLCELIFFAVTQPLLYSCLLLYCTGHWVLPSGNCYCCHTGHWYCCHVGPCIVAILDPVSIMSICLTRFWTVRSVLLHSGGQRFDSILYNIFYLIFMMSVLSMRILDGTVCPAPFRRSEDQFCFCIKYFILFLLCLSFLQDFWWHGLDHVDQPLQAINY